MSYAQLDPLVLYKKESFEKFQELLKNIINQTSSYLMKLDFELIAQRQGVQIVEESSSDEKVLQILSSASRSLPKASPQARPASQPVHDAREKIFDADDAEDDVEVFEIGETV